MNPNNYPLVRINWEDIYFSDNWSEDSDENDIQPVECITEGRLLMDTPTMILIGSSYDFKRGQWGTVHAISKAVPEIEVLIPAKEPDDV